MNRILSDNIVNCSLCSKPTSTSNMFSVDDSDSSIFICNTCHDDYLKSYELNNILIERSVIKWQSKNRQKNIKISLDSQNISCLKQLVVF